MNVYTVLGARGFVGAHLVRHLVAHGDEVITPERDEPLPRNPGHVIYCIGVTSDFRTRPFDTVESHVCVLRRMLQQHDFKSFTYLSSTRVYEHLPADQKAEEEAYVSVNPNRPFDLFNLSKLMGESLCLAMPNRATRAVRLSNVYGSGDPSENFLTSVLRDGLRTGRVVLRTPLDAAKDYIDIDDVVKALRSIPLRAKSRLINLGAGRNVTNAEIVELLRMHVGCQVDVQPADKGNVFPSLSIERLRTEIGITPKDITERFALLADGMRYGLLNA